MEYFIGLDLGGSSIKAVAVTRAGELLGQANVAFAVDGVMDWAGKTRAALSELERARGEPAHGIGLSAPGLAAADGRSIAHLPGRMRGLEGLDWTTQLGASQPVPVMNDAQAALAGEVWLGAATGRSHVLLLTLGTGVGGAAMVDGRILRGWLGRAGHLGHTCLDPAGAPDVCGTPGSLELAIGNGTIAARSRGRFVTTHELLAALHAGDADAARIWHQSVQALACAIASFINLFDPQAVIVGGGIARAGAALFTPLQQFLDPLEWRIGDRRVELLPAQLGEFAGAYGAARQLLP